MCPWRNLPTNLDTLLKSLWRLSGPVAVTWAIFVLVLIGTNAYAILLLVHHLGTVGTNTDHLRQIILAIPVLIAALAGLIAARDTDPPALHPPPNTGRGRGIDHRPHQRRRAGVGGRENGQNHRRGWGHLAHGTQHRSPHRRDFGPGADSEEKPRWACTCYGNIMCFHTPKLQTRIATWWNLRIGFRQFWNRPIFNSTNRNKHCTQCYWTTKWTTNWNRIIWKIHIRFVRLPSNWISFFKCKFSKHFISGKHFMVRKL